MSWNPVLTTDVKSSDYLELDEYSDSFHILTGYEMEEISDNLIERLTVMMKAVGTIEDTELNSTVMWLVGHKGETFFITDKSRTNKKL